MGKCNELHYIFGHNPDMIGVQSSERLCVSLAVPSCVVPATRP